MTRKITGGRYVPSRKKKLSEMPNSPRMTNLGNEKRKQLRVRSGEVKNVLLSADSALVLDPGTKKSKKVKIKSVVRSPANRYFKTTIVKGTVIETELGKARVTNRPGQEGSISAVLLID